MHKLAVVTPWGSPFIWSKFALNLAQMLGAFRREGWEVDAHFGRGIDPASRHIDCCIQALEGGADLICIVGADQIHPVDMLGRLVDRYYETGGGVITALVPFRGYVAWQDMRPFQPMAWRLRNGSGGVREFRGQHLDADMMDIIQQDEPPELERVDIIGSGVLMFDRECLEAMKPPWFYDYRDPVTMQRVADTDTRFVWRLRSEVQAQVWVDKTIRVRHIHPFEIDESFQHRFGDWVQPEATADDVFRYQDREGGA